MDESRASLKARSKKVFQALFRKYGGHPPLLHFETPFQCLIAIILSARAKDEAVNQVTPALFKKFPDAKTLASAADEEVLSIIKPVGLASGKTGKARHIIETAARLWAEHQGRIPNDKTYLTTLPGVGQKTAGVAMNQLFEGSANFPVDIHVARISFRLGFTKHPTSSPSAIEADLVQIFEPEHRRLMNPMMVLHGRETCPSRKPKCTACVLSELCPKAGVSA